MAKGTKTKKVISPAAQLGRGIALNVAFFPLPIGLSDTIEGAKRLRAKKIEEEKHEAFDAELENVAAKIAEVEYVSKKKENKNESKKNENKEGS